MKSLNKTETPIFLSVVFSVFPKAIFLTFISVVLYIAFLSFVIVCFFCTFVRIVLTWFCWSPLPLGIWEGLRFVIVAFSALFSYLFFTYRLNFVPQEGCDS